MPQPKQKLSQENHSRAVLGESLVYPVLSRRSGGLSVGINLFPDRKTCSFDCPYCEVFPFESPETRDPAALLQKLERDVDDFLGRIYPDSFAPEPLRDLCISGNGEPTLSPCLEPCLALLESARKRHPEILAATPTVIITNSTGFLNSATRELLSRFASLGRLDIWAKLDAGSPGVFRLMSGSGFRLDEVLAGLLAFSQKTPVIIQSMLCSVGDFSPGRAEIEARAALLGEFAGRGALIREVHLYTLSREACHPGVRPVCDAELLEAARILSRALPSGVPVKTFGPHGLLV